MSDTVAIERKEVVRSVLEQARSEVDAALSNLDSYDQPRFVELERAAGNLVSLFPDNNHNGGCY